MKAYSGLKHSMAPTRRGRALWMATKKAAGWAQRHVDPARPWLLHKLGNLDVALLVRGEQAPNPDSRITLSGEQGRDRSAPGQARLAAVARSTCAASRCWSRRSGGSWSGSGWARSSRRTGSPRGRWQTDPLISSHPIGGYHHMGTTRMGTDPRTSVTDPDGRVHGLANLWVAGSSLFPTGGWANPTLTIVALALRSAERISAELGK